MNRIRYNFIAGITVLCTVVFLSLQSLIFADPQVNNQFAGITLEGTVNPIIAEHIADSIEKANNEKMQFIVIRMDTPGGLMSSMREIIKSILSSKIPVVVYTYPKGAQAASAGAYIMLSAHVAVMSPGTEIGAMHPVSPMLNFDKKDGSNKEQGIMEKKVLNDTVAYARSLAQKRKRNINWTEKAIIDAISSTYIEAEKLGVIDFIAEDMTDLLKKLNRRRVDIDGHSVILNTAGIREVSYNMDWKQEFLNFFADPQIVFFLFIIAVVGIGMEVKNPGMIFPGVLGGVSFFIFLMAIRILPINILGLALIILAVVLFILELNITSYGLLTLGGIASFIVGSMILFDSPLPGMSIPISSIIAVVVFLLLFFFVVVRSVIKAHRGKVTTGIQGLIGETGSVVVDSTGRMKVMLHGEYWNVESSDEIKKGDQIVVSGLEGMTLLVNRKTD
ncbi:MAG: nodulation protein NfeD [Spirochaetes bacterium]|nr:nodulation protein NfeD [Spirochaetota bacterium]